ncbi:hypothetical protein KDA_33210 [Dictyobacter alpinus]|uniref:Uncharacterized protein n=1 Tax=Dictyobacter alpinus TaxID=2014873 RepID=A0A402B940_9CHLR|nr:hypothetical protein KDA_33210 [Dictyobacter alpinus]
MQLLESISINSYVHDLRDECEATRFTSHQSTEKMSERSVQLKVIQRRVLSVQDLRRRKNEIRHNLLHAVLNRVEV